MRIIRIEIADHPRTGDLTIRSRMLDFDQYKRSPNRERFLDDIVMRLNDEMDKVMPTIYELRHRETK